MIRSRTILLATLLLGAAPAFAEEPSHDAHHPATAAQGTTPENAMPGAMMQGGMMRGGMMQGPMMGNGMGNGMTGSGSGMSGPMMQGGGMPGAMGGGGMMSMMGMMAGAERMVGHVEGRIAYLKAELKITDAQEPLWTAFAATLRGNAQAMNQRMGEMMSMRTAATLPERIEARETLMNSHLEALRKTKAALLPLYAALSDEQKKTADELLAPMPGRFGMM